MARCFEVKKIWRGLLLAAFAFLLLATSALAAPAAPTISITDWRTGEIEVCYAGVTPGNAIVLYTTTFKSKDVFAATDTWVATAATECHITKFLENGQTIWYYITQISPDGLESPPSNEDRQTPPITAWIINWPDMFNDLSGLFDGLKAKFDDLNTHLDGLFTPSQPAIDDLKNALDELKDSVTGGGATDQIAGGLKGGFDDTAAGTHPKIINDDGNGTYTGGPTGDQLPQTPQTDDLGLIGPNPDSGTDTELTMRIPITKKMDGSWLYIKLFTKEQMDKMKWLDVLYKAAEATLWILFGMWVVQRFTPGMKV